MKKVKIIMILLLCVTLIFTLLGTFNLNTYEGLDDDEVPQCNSNLAEDVNSDTEDGNWRLKTSKIPEVCPSGPYFNFTEIKDNKSSESKEDKSSESKEDTSGSNSGKGFWSGFNIGNKNKGDDNSKNTDTRISQITDYYNKQTQEVNQANKTDNSIKQETNTSQNVQMDNSVNQDMSQTESTSADSKFNNLLGNNSIMLGSFGGGGQNSNTQTIGPSPVSTPAPANTTETAPYQEPKSNVDPQLNNMINDLKGSVAKLNQQKQENKNGQCPPCPACERCPEPAFECKKVPNYRSPSIDNYMPVPVLNDFSRF